MSNNIDIQISKNISMGNQQQSQMESPSLTNWSVIRRLQHCTVWRSTTSTQQLQQYRLFLHDSRELDRQKSFFKFRHCSQTLVSSKFFHMDTNSELCSTHTRGSLFLQRIPLRLSIIQDVPYPYVLHLYHQSLRGFAELYDRMGYFEIEQNMIGVNQDGRVKVWMNGQFQRCGFGGRVMRGTEKEMVTRLVEIVDTNTDKRTLPEDLGEGIRQAKPRSFRDADIMVRNFAAKYGIDIPAHMESVLARDDLLTNPPTTSDIHKIGPHQATYSNYRQIIEQNRAAPQVQYISPVFSPSPTMVKYRQPHIPQQYFHPKPMHTAVQTIPAVQNLPFQPPTTSSIPPSPIADMAAVLSQPALPTFDVRADIKSPRAQQIIKPASPKRVQYVRPLAEIENLTMKNRDLEDKQGFKKEGRRVQDKSHALTNVLGNQQTLNRNHNSMLNLRMVPRFHAQHLNQVSQITFKKPQMVQQQQQPPKIEPIKTQSVTLSKSTSSPSLLVEHMQKMRVQTTPIEKQQSMKIHAAVKNRNCPIEFRNYKSVQQKQEKVTKVEQIAQKSTNHIEPSNQSAAFLQLVQSFSPIKPFSNGNIPFFNQKSDTIIVDPIKIPLDHPKTQQKILSNLPITYSTMNSPDKPYEQIQIDFEKDKIEHLADAGQMKYSMYQESMLFENKEPEASIIPLVQKEQKLPFFGIQPQPISTSQKSIINEGGYSIAIDSELMKDLEKLRKGRF